MWVSHRNQIEATIHAFAANLMLPLRNFCKDHGSCLFASKLRLADFLSFPEMLRKRILTIEERLNS